MPLEDKRTVKLIDLVLLQLFDEENNRVPVNMILGENLEVALWISEGLRVPDEA
jgi:hypothetical protein